MLSIKKSQPFKVLQSYLKLQNSALTQARIGELLHIPERTVKYWSTTKFTGSAEDIYYELFKKTLSPTAPDGLLRHLDSIGYIIPNDLYNLSKENPDHFINFLIDFLAGNISKREIPIHITKVKKNIEIDEITADENNNYFPQTIYSKKDENPIYSIPKDTNSVFGELNNQKRIVIEGPGGQGKSLFLKKVHANAINSKNYKYVFRFELTQLLLISDNETYIFDTQPVPRILSYISKMCENIKDVLSCVESNTNEESLKVLFLLDGLNELFASSDLRSVSAIIRELEHITEQWFNTTIIITTRPSEEGCQFLKNYTTCYLSGTPSKKIEQFVNYNSHLSEDIKTLVKIPMYYNMLTKLNNTEKLKTKYDLLFRIYLERYNQSSKTGDSFFAFFILAPLIAREMHDHPQNSISEARVREIAEELKGHNYNLLIETIKKECDIQYTVFAPNIDNACSILLHDGPIKYELYENTSLLVDKDGEYQIFHDEVRDFLLSFSALMSLKTIRNAVKDNNFNGIKDVYVNLNLTDAPSDLIKLQLEISYKENLLEIFQKQYSLLDKAVISPCSILYAHTLFLISEYLDLGISAVEPTHITLINFTKRVIRLIKQGNFENYLKCINIPISENQKNRCKIAVTEIISKHCEYYRRNERYDEDLEMIEIAKSICPDNDAIRNQEGKLLLKMYQSHMKNPKSKDYDLIKLGVKDYTELFSKGKAILEQAANNDFCLSVNLSSMIYSVPAPFLFEDKTICTSFDFVKAFNFCRSLIFTDKRTNYTAKEISYAIRQAVGLLLKGYVKFNPDFEEYEYGDPGPNSIILGDKNTLKLDDNTIKMAKHLLTFSEGITLTTLDYYRAIVAYYDNNVDYAKYLMNNEKDTILKSIFQHYAFNEDIDLNNTYQYIKAAMKKSNRDSIDSCHPIYWYCDAKLLELAFKPGKTEFFENFEEDLPNIWKKIVKQLTP